MRIAHENEQLKQKVAELTERLIVLERIATDPAERVSPKSKSCAERR